MVSLSTPTEIWSLKVFTRKEYQGNAEARTLVAMFDAQVASHGSSIACSCARESLTYSQLDCESNRLASELKSQGVTTGDRIGICLSKSCRTLVTILAILKARATYVPLDPDYPVERLDFLCRDAQFRLIVTEQMFQGLLRPLQAKTIAIDYESERLASLPPTPICRSLDDNVEDIPAYIIYTSGSTGTPKGVVVGHASVLNFVQAMLAKPGFKPTDVLLSASTLAFDISVYDMFVPLAAGGKIVFVDRSLARDGRSLASALESNDATHMFATPTGWRMLIDAGWKGNQNQFHIFTGGEHLTPELIEPLLERAKEVWNFYGPTEATVLVTRQQITDPNGRILVGEPIEETKLFVVDENNRTVEPEEAGELLITGASLAIGYWNRPELQKEKFCDFNGMRSYRTGDLCKMTHEGRIECLGRLDNQVKIRGHRIELEEVESVLLSCPGIKQAAVAIRKNPPGEPRLIGYVIRKESVALQPIEIHAFVASRLPEYMIPSSIVIVDEFPVTPNGKLDRAALPEPPRTRPILSNEYIAPQNETHRKLESIWSRVLNLVELGIDDNFFHLGGNSILVVQMLNKVEKELGWTIPASRFFDAPTISKLASLTNPPTDTYTPTAKGSQSIPTRTNSPCADIAIVGMSARFPGAVDVDQFWKNLVDGVDSIRHFSPEELDSSIPATQRNASNYVAARGILEDVDKIDASFFGLAPREAELIDPQQRVLLELAWVALEDAGYVPRKKNIRVGVWAGCFTNTYFLKNILSHPDLVEETGEFQLATYTEKDFIASRIAHLLDLQGPAININTACSTSLVAVIEACTSLIQGHCDMALAGGATIVFPQNRGHQYQTGNILSPDGLCRPFDANAEGTVFSDGAGLVALKRLSDALRDGDRIYSVIKGVGINNDGGAKASFSAPSIQGQVGAIAMAQRMALFDADTIGYIEAHGTATPIGDPMEIAALVEVYAPKPNPDSTNSSTRNSRCAIGSVKSNIGHTVAAAGVAGLIKATLSLYHEVIPATLHFQKANPALELEKTPFSVCGQQQPWPRKVSPPNHSPRRAGVSSFGVGGTNAHILLEEAPLTDFGHSKIDERWPLQLWPYSSKQDAARNQYSTDLADFAESSPSVDVAQIATSLQERRQHFPYRAFVICDTARSAVDHLRKPTRTRTGNGKVFATRPSITWMFPGQGSQYVRMGEDLYRHVPAFRRSLDLCCDQLMPLLGQDLRQVLFPNLASGTISEENSKEILRSTRFTQPALFSIGYSLAQTWLSWGVKPDQLIGHSIGEFVAACVAGVFTLENGIRLIAKRGELLQRLPMGSMLAVQLSEEELLTRLPADCQIAAINAPKLCVVAGPSKAISELEEILVSGQIGCRQLMTSHAFHSSMMDSAVAPFTEFVSTVNLKPPQLPIRSTVTGEWLTDEQACDPSYWGQHLRSPVRFSSAIHAMLVDASPAIYMEIGPRSTLVTLAKQHLPKSDSSQKLVPSLNESAENHTELATMLHAVGTLWCSGVDIDWEHLQPVPNTKRPIYTASRLPGYPFQRKSYWISPKPSCVDTPPVTPIPEKILPQEIYSPPYNPPQTIQTSSVAMNTTSNQSALVHNRNQKLLDAVCEVFDNTSGIDLKEFDSDTTFLELGVNSLMLTQTASALQRKFDLEITFRQMLEETTSAGTLVEWLDSRLPADRFCETSIAVSHSDSPAINASESTPPVATIAPDAINRVGIAQPEARSNTSTPDVNQQNSLLSQMSSMLETDKEASFASSNPIYSIIQQQLQLMQMQLQLLSNAGQPVSAQSNISAQTNLVQQNLVQPVSSPRVANPLSSAEPVLQSSLKTTNASPATSIFESEKLDAATSIESPEPKKVFGAQARVSLQSKTVDATTDRNVKRFIDQYNIRTAKSKAYAQQHRPYLADPRTVSGFQPATKEMTYPIVVEKSKGAYVWDIDGHKYIDLTCGFGSNFFGHSPDFMVEALSRQLSTGYEIGPQSVLTGEVANLFCEMTGNERVAFCNTGSEAVLGAMRLARTVTGRDKFVMFTGDYHGILDEVIVRSNKKLVSFPAAPGIPQSAVQNVLVLEYGSDDALQTIAREKDQLAAVIVESIQSRRPDYQPKEFLCKLRQLTDNIPTALIFDEVITGFRLGPHGAQGYFGIKADLATYGKVIGGGMPIGVIAGKSRYMDALDGGFWRFGDASRPEVGMTYFAGTFVRHPLALAAAKATLLYLKSQGAEAYRHLQQISDRLENGMRQVILETGAPIHLGRFYSMIKPEFTTELPYGDLLFAAMRRRGIHIWEHRVCFLTLAHTKEDIDHIVEVFRESVRETQDLGFLPRTTNNSSTVAPSMLPPTPTALPKENSATHFGEARLGKDRQGNPTWFIPDSFNPGQFLPVAPPSIN